MRVVVVTILLIVCSLVSAQKMADASQLFDEGRYAEAADINCQLLKKKPKDGVLNMRLARCLLELGDTDEAVVYFQKAAEYGYSKANLYLGNLLFDDYHFAEAADAYSAWLQSDAIAPSDTAAVGKRLRQAQLGEQLLHRVEDIALIDSTIVPKLNFFRHITLAAEIGTFFAGEDGCVGFESGRKDRRYLAQPHQGRSRLYQSYNLMGEWSAPTLLSTTLDSGCDENCPFVATDGITIYFGSQGYEGLGGYDLFVSRYNSDKHDFLPPQNLGMPFNSPANDYLLALDEAAGIGWLVTDRTTTSDSVVIYRFVPNEQRRILRDKTDDELRDAARLRTFRTAVVTDASAMPETRRQRVAEAPFWVNDSTACTQVSDFESIEAQQGFEQLRAQQMLLAQKLFILEAKRDLWAMADSDGERSALVTDILALETEILQVRRQIEASQTAIRQAENRK